MEPVATRVFLAQCAVTQPTKPRPTLVSPHYKRETEALKAAHLWTELNSVHSNVSLQTQVWALNLWLCH